MKSIYLKNFSLTVGMVLLSFLILGTSFMAVSYSFIVSDKRESLRMTAGVIEGTVSAKLTESELDDWDLRMTISAIAAASNVDISLSDNYGTIVSASDIYGSSQHIGTKLPESLLNSLRKEEAVTASGVLEGFYSTPRYYYCTAVEDPYYGTQAGYILVSIEASSMVQIWRSFTVIFFFASCFVLILSLVFSLITTGRQVAPLKEMAAAAKHFARGEFSVRVRQTKRKDEIAELAAAFNSMAESLEKSEKLRSEFIANISHELKTPMTTITGFADGILDGTIPQEKQSTYLEIISSETRRLSRLVRRMLELSRIQAIDPALASHSSFDITEVLRHTVLGLDDRIKLKKLKTELLIPEESITVVGDADSITQVVYNLLDNAIKFSSAGSAVTLSLWKQGDKAYVSVKNLGETIAPSELPLIFDRFHKTDRSRGLDKDGVGLGLYIVKTIIDNHKENVYVTSSDGVTEFVFTLTLKA